MSEQLWLRVGDAGDYEDFGDDLDALLDYLIDAGPGVGFATPNYHGYDFISLFWGDAHADLLRPLDNTERAAVEAGLQEAYI